MNNQDLLRLWREVISEKYGYKCAFCGLRSNLDAHHIKNRNHKILLYDHRNGILLCRDCHTNPSQGRIGAIVGETDWLYLEYMAGITLRDLLFTERLTRNEWLKQCRKRLVKAQDEI